MDRDPQPSQPEGFDESPPRPLALVDKGGDLGPKETSHESCVPERDIIEWLAGRDAEIIEALAAAEAERPDLFATYDDELVHVIRMAELAGKRQLLDEIAARLSPPS